jgi:hypothetical protein
LNTKRSIEFDLDCSASDVVADACAIDVRLRFDYCAAMAKKKNTKKTENNAFLGNLDRLGGKKLTQRGAEESSRGRESRKHRVGGGGWRKSG